MSSPLDVLDPTQAKLFSAWLSQRRVLVADSQSSSRKGLAKLVIELGAKTNHLSLASDLHQAKEALDQNKPEMILAEYHLSGGSGIELAQEVAKRTEPAQKIFILVTSSTSESLVAQAAEEDVDLFILKPYTLQHVTTILCQAVLSRIYPTDYMKAIQEGKKLLKNQQLEEARKQFEEATRLHSKPALALFYQGQSALYQSLLENAETSYESGLHYNAIHYKCLTGLFDLLLDQKKLEDAYQVVRKIARFFPSHPKRLIQVINLAIKTHHFEDILEYYESFKTIDMRSTELVKHMGAALVVAGKALFQSPSPEAKKQAGELLSKATVSASVFPSLMREAILTLAEQGFIEEAQDAWRRLSKENQIDATTLSICQFAIFCHQEPSASKVLSHIIQVQREGLQDPYLDFWAIQSARKIPDLEKAKHLFEEACQRWPDQQAYFEKALQEESTPLS